MIVITIGIPSPIIPLHDTKKVVSPDNDTDHINQVLTIIIIHDMLMNGFGQIYRLDWLVFLLFHLFDYLFLVFGLL